MPGRWAFPEGITLTNLFFEQPVLNSPYECPSRHWELDEVWAADPEDHRKPKAGRIHHADSEAEKAKGIVCETSHLGI